MQSWLPAAIASALPTFVTIIGAGYYLGQKLGSLQQQVEDNTRAIQRLADPPEEEENDA